MSWDKEFKHKFFKYGLMGLCSFALVFFLGLVAYSNIAGNYLIDQGNQGFDKQENENKKEGDLFNLIFSDNNQDDNSNNNENSNDTSNNDNENNNNNEENNNTISWNTTEDTSGSSSGGGSVAPTHTHSWYKVVDSAAWTENKQVFIGYTYICNNCGFSTNDSSAMSSHCSRTSHSFRSTPRYETQQVYHPEVAHEECSCGARR